MAMKPFTLEDLPERPITREEKIPYAVLTLLDNISKKLDKIAEILQQGEGEKRRVKNG